MNVVLMIGTGCWTGAERHVELLAQGLAARGHRVRVACRAGTVVERRLARRCDVLPLPIRNVLDLGSALKLARFLTESHVDVLHAHHNKVGWLALLAARLAGVEKVFSTQHMVPDRPKRDPLHRWLMGRFRAVLCPSGFARDFFRGLFPALPTSRFVAVPNGTEDCLRDRPPARSDGTLRLLTVGRLSPRKGTDTILHAMALLKGLPIRLHLAGEFDHLAEGPIRSLVTELDLGATVRIGGFSEDVGEELAKTDVFVLPSVVPESGGPMAMVEAMSAALPVVVSASGSQGEIVRHGENGLFVPAGDAVALAAAIRTLAGDAGLRARLGANARRTFLERLTVERMVEATERVYREASLRDEPRYEPRDESRDERRDEDHDERAGAVEGDIQVLLPNLKRRFSGITATLAAVAPIQARTLGLATFGAPVPAPLRRIGGRELFALTARPLPGGRPRIFHARRNIEMLAGLVLRDLLGRRLRLLFTSTAQRHHTRWTRALLARMDAVLSTSPAAASYLERPPAAIVPHGVDLGIYRPEPDRETAWKSTGLPGTFGVGILGRVRPQKGVREFVVALCDVLPEVPGATAVIIGETTPRYAPFEAELRRYVRSRGLEERFRWMGKLPFGELPGWFRRLSLVAAVPHNEGFGLTCLEAMASGTAVVATRTGAFELLLRDGVEGRLVPCGDARALAAAFRELLGDRGRLEEMGRRGRARAEAEFSIEREARALNDFYSSLLGG